MLFIYYCNKWPFFLSSSWPRCKHYESRSAIYDGSSGQQFNGRRRIRICTGGCHQKWNLWDRGQKGQFTYMLPLYVPVINPFNTMLGLLGCMWHHKTKSVYIELERAFRHWLWNFDFFFISNKMIHWKSCTHKHLSHYIIMLSLTLLMLTVMGNSEVLFSRKEKKLLSCSPVRNLVTFRQVLYIPTPQRVMKMGQPFLCFNSYNNF